MNTLDILFVATALALAPPAESHSLEGECLALNMYYEARNQGTAGIFGVTAVVLNRVNDKRFPNTICGVVKQGPTRESWKTRKTLDKNDAIYYPIKNKCQFSWYCDGKKDTPNLKSDEWYNAKRYARMVLYGTITLDFTEGATHYHATYVRPAWAKTKTKTTRIDRHIFYRWEK